MLWLGYALIRYVLILTSEVYLLRSDAIVVQTVTFTASTITTTIGSNISSSEIEVPHNLTTRLTTMSITTTNTSCKSLAVNVFS